jgi:hypothetical protein
VSDVSDDVRRAAVMCLGFVLMSAPEQCPRIVGLLAESFNPHVRYGAAMAVGLACAGAWARCVCVCVCVFGGGGGERDALWPRGCCLVRPALSLAA